MLRRARALLGTTEEAEDVLQEVFVRVLEGRDGFRAEGPVLHWMYRITTNACLDRLRKRRTHPSVEHPDAVEWLADATRDPSHRRDLLRVLVGLDATTQAVVVHHYLDGMKMEEVGRVIGLSRKTVGRKLAEFRARARRLLGGEP